MLIEKRGFLAPKGRGVAGLPALLLVAGDLGHTRERALELSRSFRFFL
jgi:hypothetical protein